MKTYNQFRGYLEKPGQTNKVFPPVKKIRQKMPAKAIESFHKGVEFDDLNWIKTGGMVGKKRRFPTFVIKKEGNKYKAYDEQNKMDFKAGANSLEGLAKMLKPYIEKRTGSWKFEE